MIVKNIYNKNIINYVDLIVRLLIKNNINYVLIKNDDYTEIHFANYIYNIYSNKELCLNKNISDINEELYLNKNLFNINEKLLFPNPNEVIGNISSNDITYSEKSGYKKYTKRKIKKDNLNNRLHNRCVGAKSPRR